MAFTLVNWAKVSASANTKAPMIFAYSSATDAVATIKGAGYFNLQKSSLKIGDAIHIYGQDAKFQVVKITAVTPDVTVAQVSGDA